MIDGFVLIGASILVWVGNCAIYTLIHPFTFMMSEQDVRPINRFHKTCLVVSIVLMVIGIILKVIK